MTTAGQRLKVLRNKRKQKIVAEETGIPFYSLSNYENDICLPPPERLQILSDYYNKPIEYILYGTESNKEKSLELKDWLYNTTLTLNGEILTDNEKDLLIEMSKAILITRKK